jgi:hypothetical protein
MIMRKTLVALVVLLALLSGCQNDSANVQITGVIDAETRQPVSAVTIKLVHYFPNGEKQSEIFTEKDLPIRAKLPDGRFKLTVKVEASGYQPLEKTFKIKNGKPGSFEFPIEMMPLNQPQN